MAKEAKELYYSDQEIPGDVGDEIRVHKKLPGRAGRKGKTTEVDAQIVDKTERFIAVQYDNGVRECISIGDLATGEVQITMARAAKRKLKEEEKHQIARRCANGDSYKRIAEDMGVSVGTVGYHARKTKPNPEPESPQEQDGVEEAESSEQLQETECQTCHHRPVCKYRDHYHELPEWVRCMYHMRIGA